MQTYSMDSINELLRNICDNMGVWSSRQTVQELVTLHSMLTHRINTIKAMVLMPGNRHRKSMVKDVLYCTADKILTKVAIWLWQFRDALTSRSKNSI